MAKKKGCKVCALKADKKLIKQVREMIERRGAFVMSWEEDEFELIDLSIDDHGMVRVKTGDYL